MVPAHPARCESFIVVSNAEVASSQVIIGGLVEVFLGVDVEQRSLEDIATPLSVVTGKAGPGIAPQVSTSG